MAQQKNTGDQVPLNGLPGLRQNWRKDSLSGFIVFLIALPLSLGIAMASGVPPMAGVISAVVGGLIVSRINGSNVTINGPAAGLIVVIVGAVESLGGGDPMAGYRSMLAAVVISGAILFLLGRLKAGRLGDFFPASAVHGMLAAIGIIILAKQVHVALGVKPEGQEPLELLAEIPHSMLNWNPDVAIIGILSLLIMIVLPLIRNRYVKMIPAPMVVVLVGMALAHYFDLEHEHKYLFLDGHEYSLGPKFLVTLPEHVLDGIVFPDFSKALSYPFLIAVVSITLVQGIESLLSAKAVDKLDPWKRQSDLNKDLSAVGAGSAISGMIGGLPMIAEIVRSSANINNGGRTSWANFFHGLFLLVFVVAFPTLIHSIPLAALAAILMYTGYKLAAPHHFKHTLHIGREQLAIFTTTLVITLATDLIIGVFSGILLKMIIHLFRGASLRALFKPTVAVHYESIADRFLVSVHNVAIFSNYLSLKKQLDNIPKGKDVVVDFDNATLVDHTVMEHLHSYKELYERQGGTFDLKEMGHLIPRSQHPMAARRTSRKAVSA
ncbi:MAG TPA: SulP family inorganic anion transporter [Flavobacteriales bacterium]|mgnify:CR=1 FL=1|nr:SulP family inorganic anion transporter [Flavobacteriales bacterium]